MNWLQHNCDDGDTLKYAKKTFAEITIGGHIPSWEGSETWPPRKKST
jgi:hypothetical protein